MLQRELFFPSEKAMVHSVFIVGEDYSRDFPFLLAGTVRGLLFSAWCFAPLPAEMTHIAPRVR